MIDLPPTSALAATLQQAQGCVVVEGCAGSGVEDLNQQLLASEWAQYRDPALFTDVGSAGVRSVFTIGPQAGGLHQRQPVASWLEVAQCVVLVGPAVSIADPHIRPQRFGLGDLAMTPLDLAQVALERYDVRLRPGAANAVAAEAAGWNRYALYLLEAIARGLPASAIDEFRTGSGVDELVTQSCDLINAEQVSRVAELCHFDSFPARAVDDLLGEDQGHALQASGFPCRVTSDGAMQILEPVRSHLRQRFALSQDVAGKVGESIESTFGVLPACEALVRAGAASVAARRIRQLSADRLLSLDQASTAALLHVLIQQTPDDGSLRLALARVEWARGNLEQHSVQLDIAKRCAIAADRLDLGLDIDAEELLADLPTITTIDAAQRLDRLLAHAASFDGDTSLRLLEVEGMVRAQSTRVVEVVRSIELLTDVARQHVLRDQANAAGRVLRNLCVTAVEHLGRYEQGVDLAERASKLVTSDPQATAKSCALTVRMRALAGMSDGFEQLCDTAAAQGDFAGLGWIAGHVKWSRMIAAGLNGDAAAVLRLHQSAQEELGGLVDRVPGCVFIAESVIALTQAGHMDTAESVLERATTRFGQAPLEVGLATVTHLARAGQVDAATQQLEELRSHIEVPSTRYWRFQLELGCAVGSDGHKAELELLRAEAAAAGASQLFSRLAAQIGFATETHAALTVRLFGRFKIAKRSGAVLVPTGRPAQLLRMLAVADTSLHVDVAIDRLWPDVTTDIGRRRLKNVVSRIRATVGHESVHREGDLLWLADDVDVDVRQFRALATRVVAGNATTAELRRCVALFDDAPLPEDRMADWARQTVDQLTSAFAAVVGCAIETSAITPREALVAFERVGILDEALCISIASYAIEMHDASTATRAQELAMEICQELDVPMPELATSAGLGQGSTDIARAIG